MKNDFTQIPAFIKLDYSYNTETGLYTCPEISVLKPPLNTLTSELIKEPAKLSKPQAQFRIRSSTFQKEAYGFITNLYGTNYTNWYVGCQYRITNNEKCINTILVHFTIKPKELKLHYFTSYDTLGVFDRIDFANYAIPQIKNQ
jgi:hypothetical protein